jgi:hypothetical protein
MAHWLGPRDGEPHLPPDEVVARLRAEFVVVEADPQTGAEHVAAMVRGMERIGLPAEAVAERQRLQPLAVWVVLADDPEPGEAHLRFVIMPGESILIGYSSAQHERAARPLLGRCCRVLGYASELA